MPSNGQTSASTAHPPLDAGSIRGEHEEQEQPSAPPTTSAAPTDVVHPEPKTTRITKEMRGEFREYFKKAKWPRNKKMPKVNTDRALDAIIDKYKLKRDQASRQLRTWKAIQYDNAQVKLLIEPEAIETSIYESLSMDLHEFVTEFLAIVSEGREVAGCADSTNFCRSIETHAKSEAEPRIVKFIYNNPNHACNEVFVKLLERWTTIAAEEFPKSVQKMTDAELSFLVSVKRQQNMFLRQEWKPLYDTIDFTPQEYIDQDFFLRSMSFVTSFSSCQMVYSFSGHVQWLMMRGELLRSLTRIW